MITKEKLINEIVKMPEEKFNEIGILINRIWNLDDTEIENSEEESKIITKKLENGLNDVNSGNFHSEEETNKIVESWFK